VVRDGGLDQGATDSFAKTPLTAAQVPDARAMACQGVLGEGEAMSGGLKEDGVCWLVLGGLADQTPCGGACPRNQTPFKGYHRLEYLDQVFVHHISSIETRFQGRQPASKTEPENYPITETDP
jgi:hypothetical protein